ncbi:hypothetical protein Tco_0658816 [Tanacetum coccineum]
MQLKGLNLPMSHTCIITRTEFAKESYELRGTILCWPSITEDGVTRLKEYVELTPAEAIQADCDIKAINIILQGLPTEIYALVSQHRMAKDLWEKIKLDPTDSSLVVPVFQKGDDPIDAINHMMSFLTAVVTSRYLTTNNQLRTSSNPRQQATIYDGKVTVQPVQGRQTTYAAGTTRKYTPGASGSNTGKQRTTVNVNGSAVVQNLKKQDNSDCVGIHRDDCMSSDNLCVSNSLNVVKSRAKPKKKKI